MDKRLIIVPLIISAITAMVTNRRHSAYRSRRATVLSLVEGLGDGNGVTVFGELVLTVMYFRLMLTMAGFISDSVVKLVITLLGLLALFGVGFLTFKYVYRSDGYGCLGACVYFMLGLPAFLIADQVAAAMGASGVVTLVVFAATATALIALDLLAWAGGSIVVRRVARP